MKKKEITQSIKIIVLGLILSLGASYVLAQSSPPANNVAGPLNVGTSAQSKIGSLGVVGGFFTWGPALFNDTVGISGTLSVFGNTTVSSAMTVAGAGGMTISSLGGHGTKEICVNSSGQLIYCTP